MSDRLRHRPFRAAVAALSLAAAGLSAAPAAAAFVSYGDQNVTVTATPADQQADFAGEMLATFSESITGTGNLGGSEEPTTVPLGTFAQKVVRSAARGTLDFHFRATEVNSIVFLGWNGDPDVIELAFLRDPGADPQVPAVELNVTYSGWYPGRGLGITGVSDGSRAAFRDGWIVLRSDETSEFARTAAASAGVVYGPGGSVSTSLTVFEPAVPAAVPLPPAAWAGLVGLATALPAARRLTRGGRRR